LSRDFLGVWTLPVLLLLPPLYAAVMVAVPICYIQLRAWRSSILKVVYNAAVIGLANAEDIPMDAARRVEIAKKIVSVAGDHGIPPEDVIIDPLAMPIGAEPRAVTLFLETLHLLAPPSRLR